MIASIQEMSSTNTQQLRVSSRTRRSWQRRGLAVLVVSAYLLQCATADIFGMAVAYAMPKVINFAMRNLPQCKSWLSKKLGTPCQRCNPKNLAPGDELADYLTERGIVLRESLPNHPDTCKRQLDDTPDPHQTKEACDASDDCQWMEFTSCDKCGGDGFVHVSDRVEGIGNYMPSDEDLQKAVQEGDYGNLLGKFKDGALAFLPAAQSYYAELANNGCPNCVCKSSKKPRKDCTDWHPTSAGKCKTDPCSNCKRMRNRRLMARLQGSSKTQDHQSRQPTSAMWGYNPETEVRAQESVRRRLAKQYEPQHCQCNGTFLVCKESKKNKETCDADHNGYLSWGRGECTLEPCTFCHSERLRFNPSETPSEHGAEISHTGIDVNCPTGQKQDLWNMFRVNFQDHRDQTILFSPFCQLFQLCLRLQDAEVILVECHEGKCKKGNKEHTTEQKCHDAECEWVLNQHEEYAVPGF